ncbi:ASCH domain-containing protein [Maribacter hydrothermalis]|uniref:RNA-binding protein n=1 Tax=Maribacter hydrothermalis TaxID=1836467 RepID=A0A1B7ZEL3_9FLAO|nr:ASCH domain-containing protein [Maribacter hydrothermalis]APQ17521.1 RNA-binding protein [Maribacter hydrothermalis]OBR41996.1 RNA-binding protein [Maribacter hydrothermalis]
MENASARNMWGNYLKNHLEDVFHEAPKTMHFGDNEQDANEIAKLIKNGTKKAISYSLLGLQNRNEPLPKIGDYIVVTDWSGEAQCIVSTKAVSLKPYFSIDETYAQLEGNGDKTLNSWKKYYWDFFTKELQKFNRQPRESMIVVCQTIEKVNS